MMEMKKKACSAQNDHCDSRERDKTSSDDQLGSQGVARRWEGIQQDD